ncbi:MAG: hypothetical protein JRF15_02940 [Deltaproteobacteria bacterium]|jgi:hypothetical protein|nr:hypothetical protein [Deltaproteobacteria bacterium]
MAILVMFSNYFHDLATAIFAVSAVTAYLLQRSLAMQTAPASLQPVVRGIQRMGYYSLAWTLVFGAFRSMTYREYEWVEAAGRDQVPALVVKHIFLAALVITGVIFLYKLRRLRVAG